MYVNRLNHLIPVGVTAADDLSATGVFTLSYGIGQQCAVYRIGCLVTTVMNGAATNAFKRRPTYGSASGEVTIGSVIIPTTTAVGKFVYKDVSPVVLFPGEQLVFETTSAATSGGCVYHVDLKDDPEYLANQSNLVASA